MKIIPDNLNLKPWSSSSPLGIDLAKRIVRKRMLQSKQERLKTVKPRKKNSKIVTDVPKKTYCEAAGSMSPSSHEHFETCCICEDEFSSDGELTSHLLEHAEEEPYRTKLLEIEQEFKDGKSNKGQTTLKRSLPQRSTSPEVWEIVSDESDDESKNQATKGALTPSKFRLVSGSSSSSTPTITQPKATTPTTYNCNTCKSVFKDPKSYREHILTHDKPKPFACQICNKKFPFKAALRQHLHLHISDEKQYECETCHKKFSMKSMLRQHEETHKIEQRRKEPVVTRSKQPPRAKK